MSYATTRTADHKYRSIHTESQLSYAKPNVQEISRRCSQNNTLITKNFAQKNVLLKYLQYLCEYGMGYRHFKSVNIDQISNLF